VKEFRNPASAHPFGLVFGLFAASLICLLAAALAAGTLGGGTGLAVGGSGFAAYLFLFARAFQARWGGPRRGIQSDALI